MTVSRPRTCRLRAFAPLGSFFRTLHQGRARKHRHKRKRSATLNPAASPVSSGTSISTVSRSSFSLKVRLTIVLSAGLDLASDLPAVVA